MIRPSPEIVHCPSCQARNFAIDENCSQCGKSLTLTIEPAPGIRRFNLRTVMVLIGLIAVCLAPVRVSPGLSLLLVMIFGPASLRTLWAVEGRKADGRPMTFGQSVEKFVASCLITLLIAFSAATAFTVTCFPIGLMSMGPYSGSGAMMVFAFVAGGAAAISVIYSMGKWLWPRKD